MKKILEKIAWKTRRWNFSFSLLDMAIHDHHEAWGFDFISVYKDFHKYSLLSFWFRLPNKTTVQRFCIDEIDFMFLRRYFHRLHDDLSDRDMWSRNLTPWENFVLSILEKVIK